MHGPIINAASCIIPTAFHFVAFPDRGRVAHDLTGCLHPERLWNRTRLHEIFRWRVSLNAWRYRSSLYIYRLMFQPQAWIGFAWRVDSQWKWRMIRHRHNVPGSFARRADWSCRPSLWRSVSRRSSFPLSCSAIAGAVVDPRLPNNDNVPNVEMGPLHSQPQLQSEISAGRADTIR